MTCNGKRDQRKRKGHKIYIAAVAEQMCDEMSNESPHAHQGNLMT